MKELLGDKLILPDDSAPQPAVLPSPEDLRYKVLVKAKKKRASPTERRALERSDSSPGGASFSQQHVQPGAAGAPTGGVGRYDKARKRSVLSMINWRFSNITEKKEKSRREQEVCAASKRADVARQSSPSLGDGAADALASAVEADGGPARPRDSLSSISDGDDGEFDLDAGSFRDGSFREATSAPGAGDGHGDGKTCVHSGPTWSPPSASVPWSSELMEHTYLPSTKFRNPVAGERPTPYECASISENRILDIFKTNK